MRHPYHPHLTARPLHVFASDVIPLHVFLIEFSGIQVLECTWLTQGTVLDQLWPLTMLLDRPRDAETGSPLGGMPVSEPHLGLDF